MSWHLPCPRDAVVSLVVLGGFAVAAAQCMPSTPATRGAAEAAYGAQLLDCVDQAQTLAESRACRAKVDAAWGVDGGAR